MINEEVYKSLLDRIIENELIFYGKLTIDIFRRVNGLDVSDDGKVLTIPGDFKNIIQDLVVEFKKLDGNLSLKLIRNIIEAYRSSCPDVEFPVI
jgi:hypothetical protein